MLYENYLSENIKFFREKEDISIIKLSYKCEVSKFVLSNIEERKTLDPSISAVIGIAKAMQVSVDDLVNKNFKEGVINNVNVDNMTTENENWKLAENVNNFIESRNLENTDVAKLFNITDTTVVSLRFKRKTSSRLFQIQRIAKAMNITLDELLFKEMEFN